MSKRVVDGWMDGWMCEAPGSATVEARMADASLCCCILRRSGCAHSAKTIVAHAMAGSILRRIFQRPYLHFEADWSAISPQHLGLLFKELLSDFVGAPPPPDVFQARQFYQRAWKTANLSDLYFHRHLSGPVQTGFLVRGIIYDMPSLIQTTDNKPAVSQSALDSASSSNNDPVDKLDVKRRDWASLLDLDTNAVAKENSRVEEVISADQVIESLGLKSLPGLQSRVGAVTVRKERPKSRMEEKQALEEIIGRGDSIRAKYASKIFQKKMLAEARREQTKLGIVPTAGPKATSKGLQARPGAPALVRYLEERGLNQALMARGQEEDLTCLLDQLGNYQFQHVTHVRQENDEATLGEPLSNESLKRICSTWGLPSKQVMVVIGTGASGEAALKATGDSGFFVCRINNSLHEDGDQNGVQSLKETSMNAGRRDSKKGLLSWFNQLKEGTLHVEDDRHSMRHLYPQGHVHFSVTDMVELKWVIEDLNGVSYRKSTLISGFQDLGHGAKQP